MDSDNFEVTSDQSESDENATFAGDRGELPAPARRVLVQLLSGPFIDGKRQPKQWATLLLHVDVLRSRLHDLYLDLMIDHEEQAAFVRQVVSPELDIPVILRRANLTFLETVLLLQLRQHLTDAVVQGERAVIDLKTMQDYLRVYERHGNTDKARFEKQILGAIEKCKKLNLLTALKSEDGRFEIAPTLKLLFPVEEIEQLTRIYKALLDDPAAAMGTGTTEADTEED